MEKIILFLLRLRGIEIRNERMVFSHEGGNLYKDHIESSDRVVQDFIDSLDFDWGKAGAYFKQRLSQSIFQDIYRAQSILRYVGERLNIEGVGKVYISQRWLGHLVEENEFGLDVTSYRSCGKIQDSDYLEIYSPNRYLGMFAVQKYFLYMLFTVVRFVPMSWPSSINPSVLLFLHEKNEERKYFGHSSLTDNLNNCGVITNDLRLEYEGGRYRINRLSLFDVVKYFLHIRNGCSLFGFVANVNPIYRYKLLIEWVRLFFFDAMLKKMQSKVVYSCYESSNAMLLQYVAKNNEKCASMVSTYSGGEFPVKYEFSHQNKFSDVYFVWGGYLARLYQSSGDFSLRYVVSGYVGDIYKDEFRCRGEEIRETLGAKKIIAVYDTTYASDLFLDIDAVEKFVSSVIDVAVEFDAKVVVKTKKGSGIFERLMRKYPDRIVMINTRADIAPSMCADVTVGYLLSSPVIVSGVWGRNVLLHDPDRIIWDEWYNKEDSSFISCSAYELQRNMRRILSSEGINPTDMSAVDPFGDGKSQERIVAYISDVIDNFAGGKSHALDVASSNYRQKYGNDKVINNSLLYN